MFAALDFGLRWRGAVRCHGTQVRRQRQNWSVDVGSLRERTDRQQDRKNEETENQTGFHSANWTRSTRLQNAAPFGTGLRSGSSTCSLMPLA